jgi:hypothetical protein
MSWTRRERSWKEGVPFSVESKVHKNKKWKTKKN